MRIRIFPTRRRILILLLLGAIFLSAKLLWTAHYRVTGTAVLNHTDREDLLKRRAYILDRLSRAVNPQDMPASLGAQFQGEWALVTYSMSALALTNIAQFLPETAAESRKVVRRLLRAVLRKEIRAFDSALWGEDPLSNLEHLRGHVGYLGHLNMVLAACHYLEGGAECTRQFRNVSKALSRALERTLFLNAETYPGEIYIPDNAVVVGSVGLYNQAFPDERVPLVEHWIEKVQRDYLDSTTGLLVFDIGANGKPLQGSRGSGAAWNIFFLSYADLEFAKSQYHLLRRHLRKKLFPGVTGVLEWPDGRWGPGDVDSGPVIFGLSPSGSGFSIAGAVLAQDRQFLSELLFTAELVGSTVETKERRHYLLAPLVGDAIILAMRTVTSWRAPKTGASPGNRG